MQERKGIVTSKGQGLTLLGTQLEIGQQMPDCQLVSNDMSPVKLSDYLGKVCLICSLPSLYTVVCEGEKKEFNKQVSEYGDKAVILVISMDLPFSQSKWCSLTGVDNIITLSDYHYREFGQTCGLLIKELMLLTRAVIVVDRQGVIRYLEIVSEVSNEPDFDSALAVIRELI